MPIPAHDAQRRAPRRKAHATQEVCTNNLNQRLPPIVKSAGVFPGAATRLQRFTAAPAPWTPAPWAPCRRATSSTGAAPQLVDGVFYLIFFGFSAARARARFREVVFHGTKDVENKFRASGMYSSVRGSSRFVAESDMSRILAWLTSRILAWLGL